jgi:hypothetical protein
MEKDTVLLWAASRGHTVVSWGYPWGKLTLIQLNRGNGSHQSHQYGQQTMESESSSGDSPERTPRFSLNQAGVLSSFRLIICYHLKLGQGALKKSNELFWRLVSGSSCPSWTTLCWSVLNLHMGRLLCDRRLYRFFSSLEETLFAGVGSHCVICMLTIEICCTSREEEKEAGKWPIMALNQASI